MVTENQIDDLHTRVRTKLNEISLAFQAAGQIKLVRPQSGPPITPKNPIKFRDFNQAERDAIFADIETELARIKADL